MASEHTAGHHTKAQHGFSYPISSLNKLREKSKQYVHPSYDPNAALVPHGVAVALTAPAVFNFTAPSSPSRHRDAAAIFMGKDRAHELNNVKDADIGAVLSEEIQRFLDVVEVPRGLTQVGYGTQDINSVSLHLTLISTVLIVQLVMGALPQRRVLNLAPGLSRDNQEEEKEQLSGIIEKSLSW